MEIHHATYLQRNQNADLSEPQEHIPISSINPNELYRVLIHNTPQ